MTLIEALRADSMERQKRLRSLTLDQRAIYGEEYRRHDYFAAHYPAHNGVDVMFVRSVTDQPSGQYWIIAGNTEAWLPNLAAVELVLLMEYSIPYNRGWEPGHEFPF